MSEQPLKEGDAVALEAVVVKVQDNGSLIVKFANNTHGIFHPEHLTKKP